MDQATRIPETGGKIQKAVLPGKAQARERASEKTQPVDPFFPGEATGKIRQGCLKSNLSEPGLSVLVAEHATPRTSGEREKNRKQPERGSLGFRRGKTQARFFHHFRQKEKKTSC
jgi:predicted ATPase